MSEALIYCSVTGITFALILLLYNKGYKTANRYLAGFFFFISLFVLSQYSGLYGNSRVLAALLASSPTPFFFLIGPFFFLYTRSVLKDNARLKKGDYLHFLLFVLEFAGMIPYYLSSWESKLAVADTLLSNDWKVTQLGLNRIFVSPVNSYLRPLHITSYLIVSWYWIWQHRHTARSAWFQDTHHQLVWRWLITLQSVFSLFLVCYGINTVNLFLYTSKQAFRANSAVFLFSATATFILLNLFTLLFPQILYGMPRWDTSTGGEADDEQKTGVPVTSESQLHEIQLILDAYLESAKPWTDPEFSLNSLSHALEIPEHHLRYFLNHFRHTNFSQFRNKLRVDHVKQLIASPDNDHLSIEGMGTLAGFSSKSSFYAVFKKETGYTPKEFKDQQRQIS